jgi:hypothetical protein
MLGAKLQPIARNFQPLQALGTGMGRENGAHRMAVMLP